MKISWQLEILFFRQPYTWLRFHLLMETTCKILITGWQLRTEEVMALLNAGSRFHQCFLKCPAYSFMWGNDSAVDPWSSPRSLPQTGSLCSMDVIWVSCERVTWDLMLPWCFYVGFILPVGSTDWQMILPGACQYRVKQVAKSQASLEHQRKFLAYLGSLSHFFDLVVVVLKLDSRFQQTTASALILMFDPFPCFISQIVLQIRPGAWLHRHFTQHNEGPTAAIGDEDMSRMASWKQKGRQQPRKLSLPPKDVCRM